MNPNLRGREQREGERAPLKRGPIDAEDVPKKDGREQNAGDRGLRARLQRHLARLPSKFFAQAHRVAPTFQPFDGFSGTYTPQRTQKLTIKRREIIIGVGKLESIGDFMPSSRVER